MYQKSLHGAVHIIAGDESLVESTIDELGNLARDLLGTGQPLSVLDMSSIPLIDSAGLEALLDIKDAFEERGGHLKLANPLPLCREILEITGVGREFELFESISDAVGSFSK